MSTQGAEASPGNQETCRQTEEDDDENCDDSESFQTTKAVDKSKSTGQTTSEALKLQQQITRSISPKWPNRVFAVELLLRIIQMCASGSSLNNNTANSSKSKAEMRYCKSS